MEHKISVMLKVMSEQKNNLFKLLYVVQGLSPCQSSCPSSLSLYLLAIFEPCDWLTRISLVILPVLSSEWQIVLFGSTSTDSGSKQVPQNKRKSDRPTNGPGEPG